MRILISLFVVHWSMFALSLFAQVPTESIEDWRGKLSPNHEELLATLDRLEEHVDLAKQLVPDLTSLLSVDSTPTRKLTVRCLGKAGSDAAPAIDSLIALLDHSDYTLRIEVMECLKSLGITALPKLKEALQSNSPRIRSFALSLLNHASVVEADLLEKLQQDADGRVRLCVAQAWQKHGKVGVAQICKLTEDEDAAVAVAAVDSLRHNYADPSTAVEYLRKSVGRIDTWEQSVYALESFGVDAQIAIPELVSSFHLKELPFYVSFGSDSITHEALSHIGPIRIADLDRLLPALNHPSPQTRELAASVIGALGLQGIAAAPDLEKSWRSSMIEHRKVLEQMKEITDENERRDFSDDNRYYEHAALEAIETYWQVTGDMEKVAQLIEETARCWDEAIFFYGSPFDNASFSDAEILLKLWQSDNENVRLSATLTYHSFPVSAMSLDHLKDSRQFNNFGRWTLKRIGENGDPEWRALLVSWVLEELEKGNLTLWEVADIVIDNKIRDPKLETIFRDSLFVVNSDKSSCLNALASMAESDNACVKFLISSATKDPTLQPDALRSLMDLPSVDDEAIRFATDCLKSSEKMTVFNALSVLAKAGQAAQASLPIVKMERKFKNDYEQEDYREYQLVAIALLTNDKGTYQAELEHFFRYEGELHDLPSFSPLERVGKNGKMFIPEIAAYLAKASSSHENRSDHLRRGFRLLWSIGSDEAKEILRSYVNDRDWEVQNKARIALEALHSGTKFVFDNYSF